MVERSLERLAADRGVTICFADLDGADGLWVPEERTILVDRRLSERQAAEVLEHELAHVDIDDGHAAIDAAVGARPAPSTRWTAVVSAAASVALLGGVYVGLSGSRPDADLPSQQVVAPTGAAPISGPPQPLPETPQPSSMVTQLVAGQVRVSTVPPASTSRPPPTSAAPPATRQTSPAAQPPVAATPPPAPTTAPPTGGSPPTTPPVETQEPSPSPEPSPTAPVDTTIDDGVGAGLGDGGLDGAGLDGVGPGLGGN